MCTRYISPEEAEIERFWHIGPRNLPRQWERFMYPRAMGPFIRVDTGNSLALAVGQWGLIPWFAKSSKLTYSTVNARFEGIEGKASYKQPWTQGQRCIIPALSFDEPCWETGKNVWWTFRRTDGAPWGLAGLWNAWVDKETGEVIESYTMLTQNADAHPIMRRMHKPDPKLPVDQQDKRSVVAIEPSDVEQWLRGSVTDAAELIRMTPADAMEARPVSR
jgi:putative SOS response-associated peptidase YedK